MPRRLSPAVLLGLTQLVGEGSAFLRNLILARLLGAEEMGLAVAVALGIRLFEMIGDLGLERWLVQVGSDDLHRARGTVHSLQAIKGLLLTGLAMALAVPLTRALQPQLSPAIFALAAIAIGIRGLVNCDYRERQRNRDYLATLQVEGGSNMLALCATAPIAMLTQDYSAFAWAAILQATTMCMLSHIVARRSISFTADVAFIRRALRFGFPIACNAALMFLAMQGDRLLVAVYFEPEVLAAFALGAQLTLFPALAGAKYLLMFDLPRFSRLTPRANAWQSLFRTRFLRIAAIAASLVVTLGVFGDELVGTLYGPEFTIDPWVMGLLALAAGIRLLRAVPNTVLMAMGRTPVLLAGNLPRIGALCIALGALATGKGLATVVFIGVLSEVAGLVIGLTALRFDRRRPGMAQTPLRAS
jgi:O-antigen/teichoic acid export membrane protein